MENLFNLVGRVENEHHILDQVNQLQESFSTIRNTYREDYNHDVLKLISFFKEKMKNNGTISTTIDNYVNKYVKDEYKEEGKEDLYNLLCAEMVDTFIALSHTTNCTII